MKKRETIVCFIDKSDWFIFKIKPYTQISILPWHIFKGQLFTEVSRVTCNVYYWEVMFVNI